MNAEEFLKAKKPTAEEFLSGPQMNRVEDKTFRMDGLGGVGNPLSFAASMLKNPVFETGLQGLSLRSSDEAIAGAKAGAEFLINKLMGNEAELGDLFDRNISESRQRMGEFREEHPVAAPLVEIAGAAAPALATFGATAPAAVPGALARVGEVGKSLITTGVPASKAGAGIGRQALNTAAGGSILGGISGFAGAEGGLEERGIEGAKGAGIGMVAGPIASAVGQGVAGAAATGIKALNDLSKGPVTKAVRKIAQDMMRDGMDARDIAKEIHRLGPQATVADAGGENIKALARQSVAFKGPAKQQAKVLFDERSKGAGGRVTNAIKDYLAPDADFHQSLQMLQKRRFDQSQPLYDSVMQPEHLVPKEKMFDTLKDDFMKNIFAETRKDRLFMSGLPEDTPNNALPVIDAVKKRLDDMIGAAKRAGEPNRARLLLEKKNQLLSVADDAFPEYAAARQVWSGDSANMEALESGRKFLNQDVEITKAAMDGMTESEKEFFRIGAARAMRDRVFSKPDTGKTVDALDRNPLIREKIEQIFPGKGNYEKFMGELKREARFEETRFAVFGGSQTGRNVAEQKDQFIDPNVVSEAMNNGPGAALAQALQNAFRKSNTLDDAVSGELAQILFTQGPAGNQQFLNALSQQGRALHLEEEAARALANSLNRAAATQTKGQLGL